MWKSKSGKNGSEFTVKKVKDLRYCISDMDSRGMRVSAKCRTDRHSSNCSATCDDTRMLSPDLMLVEFGPV